MTFLRRLLKKELKTKDSHKMIDLEFSQLNNYPSGLSDIQERKIDGFIIRNVFDREEVKNLKEGFNNLSADEKVQINDGLIMYPKPFSLVDQQSKDSQDNIREYFADCELMWDNFHKRFQVDFKNKIFTVLETITSGSSIEIPTGYNDEGIYPPATFKKLLPNTGTLKPHCGNYFHKEFSTIFQRLDELSFIKNQLSYFVVLDTPEFGGELVLFDVEWKDAEIRLSGDTVLKNKKGQELDLENTKKVKRQLVNPNPGDVVVFAGGEIWHKIDFVKGNKPRLSISGFITKAREGNKYFIWS